MLLLSSFLPRGRSHCFKQTEVYGARDMHAGWAQAYALGVAHKPQAASFIVPGNLYITAAKRRHKGGEGSGVRSLTSPPKQQLRHVATAQRTCSGHQQSHDACARPGCEVKHRSLMFNERLPPRELGERRVVPFKHRWFLCSRQARTYAALEWAQGVYVPDGWNRILVLRWRHWQHSLTLPLHQHGELHCSYDFRLLAALVRKFVSHHL